MFCYKDDYQSPNVASLWINLQGSIETIGSTKPTLTQIRHLLREQGVAVDNYGGIMFINPGWKDLCVVEKSIHWKDLIFCDGVKIQLVLYPTCMLYDYIG
jgi:hypothetical protein